MYHIHPPGAIPDKRRTPQNLGQISIAHPHSNRFNCSAEMATDFSPQPGN
jgi:hypothetical protein